MNRLMTRAEYLTVRNLDDVEAVRLLLASSKVHAGPVEIHNLSEGIQVVFTNVAAGDQPAHIALVLSLELGVARVMFTALHVSPLEMSPLTPAVGEAHATLEAALLDARGSWPNAPKPARSAIEDARARLMAKRAVNRPETLDVPGERCVVIHF